MNKNMLILSGSPRKGGNSDRLCDQFLLGARESGDKVEKIRLTDLKIQPLHRLRCLCRQARK